MTSEFTVARDLVLEEFQTRINQKVQAASTLSAVYSTVYQKHHNGYDSNWPNATLFNFDQIGNGLLYLSNSRAISYNPILRNAKELENWEAYALEKALTGGLDFSNNLLGETDDYTGRIIKDGIFRKARLDPDGPLLVSVDERSGSDAKFPVVPG